MTLYTCIAVGQDNLDSLCRMMEEIAVLKEHNSKLQERLDCLELEQQMVITSPAWLAEDRTAPSWAWQGWEPASLPQEHRRTSSSSSEEIPSELEIYSRDLRRCSSITQFVNGSSYEVNNQYCTFQIHNG